MFLPCQKDQTPIRGISTRALLLESALSLPARASTRALIAAAGLAAGLALSAPAMAQDLMGTNVFGYDTSVDAADDPQALAGNSTAIGADAKADNGSTNGIAIGTNALITGGLLTTDNIAIGTNAKVFEQNSIAIGFNALVTNNDAGSITPSGIAVGSRATTHKFLTQIRTATSLRAAA